MNGILSGIKDKIIILGIFCFLLSCKGPTNTQETSSKSVEDSIVTSEVVSSIKESDSISVKNTSEVDSVTSNNTVSSNSESSSNSNIASSLETESSSNNSRIGEMPWA